MAKFRHHTQEEKQRAIELYISSGFSPTFVRRTLGYPSRSMLSRWYNDYLRDGFVRKPEKWAGKYTAEQKKKAIEYYLNHGKNRAKTVRDLGYPSQTLLYEWTKEFTPKKHRTYKPPKKFSAEDCIEILVELAASRVTQVAERHDISEATLYNWQKKFLGEEVKSVVTKDEHDDLLEQIKALSEKVDQLEAKANYHRMEVAIWEKAAELIKKDQGIDLRRLTNQEKTILVDALKTRFPLNNLLAYLKLSRSSYYYQTKALRAPDKYALLRVLVREEFEAEGGCRGHRTVWARLRRRAEPVLVSEKVVLRIMKEEGLCVLYSNKKRRHYNSYKGEIGEAPKNLVERNFHSSAPNTLWLTDITQFTTSEFRCYLSAVIDTFDGKVVARKISEHPNAELANTMLDEAIATLSEGEHPICHNDRGCHYRWDGWIERCERAGIVRSMSAKGCSADNAACEGFFGRIKNEFFYGRDWKGTTFEEFSQRLDAYIEFYNEGRIKKSLGWKSPNEYRRSLGIAA